MSAIRIGVSDIIYKAIYLMYNELINLMCIMK